MCGPTPPPPPLRSYKDDDVMNIHMYTTYGTSQTKIGNSECGQNVKLKVAFPQCIPHHSLKVVSINNVVSTKYNFPV